MNDLIKLDPRSVPSPEWFRTEIQNLKTIDRWKELNDYVLAAEAINRDTKIREELDEARKRLNFKMADMIEEGRKQGTLLPHGTRGASQKGKKGFQKKVNRDSGAESLLKITLDQLGLSDRKLQQIREAGRVPKDKREDYIRTKSKYKVPAHPLAGEIPGLRVLSWLDTCYERIADTMKEDIDILTPADKQSLIHHSKRLRELLELFERRLAGRPFLKVVGEDQ